MRLTKRQLKKLIETVIQEADKTDPGIGQEVDQDKTDPGDSYVDQQMTMRGIEPQKKPDDAYDRAKAQDDIDYGDTRNRKLFFGPRPEGRSEPITDDDLTMVDLDFNPAGPTKNQARLGQEYYSQLKDMDQYFDSVDSDRTQSYGSYDPDKDTEDEDTEESTMPASQYGEQGKTVPSLAFDDDDTEEDPGDTIHSINPDDDFDLSLSDIEPEDFGTFEDDDSEYTDGEFADQEYSDDESEEGMIEKLRNYFSKFFK